MDASTQFLTTALDYGVAFVVFLVFLFVGYRAMKWANERAKELLALMAKRQESEDARFILHSQQVSKHEQHNEIMAKLLSTQSATLTGIGNTMASMVSVLDNIHDDTKQLPETIASVGSIHTMLVDLKKAIEDGTATVQELIAATNGNKSGVIHAIEEALELLYQKILIEFDAFKRETQELRAYNAAHEDDEENTI